MAGEYPLSISDIHDVLRNERRRQTLRLLGEHNGEMEIRELSERIAAIESDQDPPPRNVRQSVYVSLHQTHLPKLHDLDIVNYDTDAKIIKFHDHAAEVLAYIETEETTGSHRLSLYLLLSGIGIVVTGLSIFDVELLPIATDVVGMVLFGLLFVTAVIHYRSRIIRRTIG